MAGAPLPLRYEGDGAFKVPSPHWGKRADAEYVIGEVQTFAPVEDRSAQSHRHFFASLHEAWLNLPEHVSARFVTSEHLRKYALIKSGFRDERSITASSKAEAHRVAAFVKPLDEFAVVTVSEATVTIYTAKSQSMRAMGKKAFQESKDKVLDIAWGMAGIDRDTHQQEAGKAA